MFLKINHGFRQHSAAILSIGDHFAAHETDFPQILLETTKQSKIEREYGAFALRVARHMPADEC